MKNKLKSIYGLCVCTETQEILYEVKSQYDKLKEGIFKGLTEIQCLLLREEELSQSHDYLMRPTTRRDPKTSSATQANNVMRHHKVAMATQSNKVYNTKKSNLGPCHSCGKYGHLLRDCKTTLEMDKKCIWDMICSSRHSAKLPAREANQPVPNLKTIHPSAMESYASKLKGGTSSRFLE